MSDCSGMKSVRVGPEGKRAWVEPGAFLHDVDVETQAHGLVLPEGFVSLVGIAGLPLGGGIGYLSRSPGLTVKVKWDPEKRHPPQSERDAVGVTPF